MTGNEYIQNVLRTESPHFLFDVNNIPGGKETARLLHGAMGLSTEANELLDAVKKFLFYGKPLDNVNIKEEAGDLLWYISIVMDIFGWNFEEVWAQNIAKLRARYPEKFTQEKAVNRDLENERKVLEKPTPSSPPPKKENWGFKCSTAKDWFFNPDKKGI